MLLLVVLAVGLLAAVDIRIRPMLKTYGVNQATTAATRAVNDAAQRVLNETGMGYDDLAVVTKDAEGKILSVSTNTANMNRLKSAVGDAVLEELQRQETQTVEIPLGSILGRRSADRPGAENPCKGADELHGGNLVPQRI